MVKNHHVRSVHLKSLSAKCIQCNKTFSTKGNLTHHIKKVHEKKTSECDVCGKSVLHINLHKKVNHSKDDQSIKCHQCEKTLKNVQHFKRHIKQVHFQVKPFKCEVCKKDWTTPQKLRRHFDMVHLNKKNHCKICDTSFKYDLKRHMRRHVNVPEVQTQKQQL